MIMTEITHDDRGLPGWVFNFEDGQEIMYTEETIAVLLRHGKAFAEK